MQEARHKAPQSVEQDAIALLTKDHKKVKAMFKEFEKLTQGKDNDEEKEALVQQICTQIVLHAKIEEDVFYPAVRKAIGNDDLMDEADVEHAAAENLIEQLESMVASDDHYDAKVTVLGEQIDHHVKEEQDTMFPKARAAGIDLLDLGAKILQRKEELQAD